MTYISQVLDAFQKSYNTYADLLFQGVNVSNTVIELCKRFLGVPQESIFSRYCLTAFLVYRTSANLRLCLWQLMVLNYNI